MGPRLGARRSAITLRMPVRLIRALSPAEIAGKATLGGALGVLAEAAVSKSFSTMRPPGPLPWIVVRSRFFSAAILRASGEAFTRVEPDFSGAAFDSVLSDEGEVDLGGETGA